MNFAPQEIVRKMLKESVFNHLVTTYKLMQI